MSGTEGYPDPQFGTYDPWLPITPPTPAPVPALDVATFRAILPEFGSAAAAVTYPDAAVAGWITQAANFVNAARWGVSAPLGTALWVAHALVLGQQAAVAVAAGGVPGASGNVIASKSIGPLSKSYDTTLGTLDGLGAFNLTVYGVRFQQMARLFGAGGVQL